MTRHDTTDPQTEKDFHKWREARWNEIVEPNGKASVIAKTEISGPEEHVIEGIPGTWRVNDTGKLTVTALPGDEIVVGGDLAVGTVDVPSGQSLNFSEGRIGMAGGMDGSYGVVVFDEQEVSRSGLTGIDAYPYDPRWILRGTFTEVEAGRRTPVERLTQPRTIDHMPAPVNLSFTIDGIDIELTVLEEIPGQGLVVFTDETSGADTPDIGRWLVLPLAPAGTEVVVDLNRITVSYHHISPRVFTCPLPPAGNHIPLRLEAGERNLLREELADKESE